MLMDDFEGADPDYREDEDFVPSDEEDEEDVRPPSS